MESNIATFFTEQGALYHSDEQKEFISGLQQEVFRILRNYLNSEDSTTRVSELKQECIQIVELVCKRNNIPLTLKNLTSPEELFTLITGLNRDLYPQFADIYVKNCGLKKKQ